MSALSEIDFTDSGQTICTLLGVPESERHWLFEESCGRFSSLHVVTPVEWTRSNRHTGIRQLVVELAA